MVINDSWYDLPLTGHSLPSFTTCVISSGRRRWAPTSGNKNVNKQRRLKRCVWYWLSWLDDCDLFTNSFSQFHLAAPTTSFLFGVAMFTVVQKSAPIGQHDRGRCGICQTSRETARKFRQADLFCRDVVRCSVGCCPLWYTTQDKTTRC